MENGGEREGERGSRFGSRKVKVNINNFNN